MHTRFHRAPDSASQYSERNGPLATSVLSKTGAKKASSKVAAAAKAASPKKPASVKKAAAPKAAALKDAAPKKAAVAKSAAPKASKKPAVKTATKTATKAAPKAVIPKKAAAKAKKPAAVRDSATETLNLVLARLDDMKAEETVTIDLRGRSAFSDYMVVTTGRSNRHVGAVAENVAKGLKEAGQKKLHVEGLTNCDWVLIDTGEVILHVFRPEVREFYNLERLYVQRPSDDARPELKAV
jgi:ribosome-associated protein